MYKYLDENTMMRWSDAESAWYVFSLSSTGIEYANYAIWLEEGNTPLPAFTPSEQFQRNTATKLEKISHVSDEISMLMDFVNMGQDVTGEADRLLALRNWRLAVYRLNCVGAWPFVPNWPALPPDIPGTNSVTSRNLKA